jgi:site-specific DNA-methyltransferase (cytosine-N4-specific)
MKKLLATQNYNRGVRPSGHTIGEGFLKENKGAIPSSVLTYANSKEDPAYREWCKEKGVSQHPARMPEKLAEFFINLTTVKNSLVLDPFGGSCTTGKSAELLKRKWICIEQNKEYLIGARGRFLSGMKMTK